MPERWHVSIVNPPTESEQATMMRRAVPYLASLLREVKHDGGVVGAGGADCRGLARGNGAGHGADEGPDREGDEEVA